MRVITPLDLRRSLGRILDEASAGERFVIERDHRPMAVLVSVEDGQRLDDDREVRLARWTGPRAPGRSPGDARGAPGCA
jgi:antitoxin (DNA-binding transcriptional repressor) of toxin-antitoxin stability system